MRHNWSSLDEAELNLDVYEWDEILIDFNGPQVATLTCGDDLFLGVAADEQDHTVRWVLAPMTPREMAALSHGLLGTLDVFKKDALRVLDLDLQQERFVSAWAGVSVDELDTSALPDPNAKLDRFMESRPLAQDQRRFILDSPAMDDAGIDFKTLSRVLSDAQRVWSSIAQALEDEPTARGTLPQEIRQKSKLRTRALRAGSIIIDVSTTEHEDLHEKVAGVFADLIIARDDEERLQDLFTTLKTRARATYTDFLKSLSAGGVEFEMNFKHHHCYTNAQLAARARRRIESPSRVRAEPDIQELTGTFRGFDLNGSFAFMDHVNEELIQGTVPGNAEVALPIEVGKDSVYIVTVETSLTRQLSGETKQDHVLLRAQRHADEAPT